MSYYAMDRAMYQSSPAGTPGWQQGPVPGWGINPFRAGPARVGVGCAACAAGGIGQESTEGNGLTAAHWALIVGAVGLLVYGAWWYSKKYPDMRDALESDSDRSGAGAMGRYQRKRSATLDEAVDILVKKLGWDRERAIRAVY